MHKNVNISDTAAPKFRILTRDFRQPVRRTVKIMLPQFVSSAAGWHATEGIYRFSNESFLCDQARLYAQAAVEHEVDLLIFPENSVPEHFIKELKSYSRRGMIIVGGSHYRRFQSGYASRCPIIIGNRVYYTDKIYPSFLEKTPLSLLRHGLQGGENVIVFKHTRAGNFAVLICADFLKDGLRDDIMQHHIDLLLVPAFQKNSKIYHNQSAMTCQMAESGIYIIYANMKCNGLGVGQSALFGVTDKKYFADFVGVRKADPDAPNKLWTLRNKNCYIIAKVDLMHKRPYAMYTADSGPNVDILVEKRIVMKKSSFQKNTIQSQVVNRTTNHRTRELRITQNRLIDFINESAVIGKIDLFVSKATKRPIVDAEEFTKNYMSRLSYMKIVSLDVLTELLQSNRQFLQAFLIEFSKGTTAKTWSFTPAGMCISFLCYARILRDSGIPKLTRLLEGKRINELPASKVAAPIARAYRATVKAGFLLHDSK